MCSSFAWVRPVKAGTSRRKLRKPHGRGNPPLGTARLLATLERGREVFHAA
jgi:hypothetical protein